MKPTHPPTPTPGSPPPVSLPDLISHVLSLTFYSILLFLNKEDAPFTHRACLPAPTHTSKYLGEKMGEQNSSSVA